LTPKTVRLPDGRLWLRVASPDWEKPLDPSFARTTGGRWNAPNSFPALYLNANVVTARLQIERLLDGTASTPDDLADDAYVLVAAQLPPGELAADAVTDEGLNALGLPASYPVDGRGVPIPHSMCQPIGAALEALPPVQGVWCRSACSDDGRGRELAWFARGHRATAAWRDPLPYRQWRYAEDWIDIDVLEHQPDPA